MLFLDVKFCLKTKMLSNSNLIKKNIKPNIYIKRKRKGVAATSLRSHLVGRGGP
jgi:hypothetical protein